jgi:hypothetical protein
METERSTETSVNFFRTRQRYNLEDSRSCDHFESNAFQFCPLAAAILCVTHQHTITHYTKSALACNQVLS